MDHADLLKKLLSDESPASMGRNFVETLHEKPYEAIDPSKVSLPDGYTVLITGAGKGIGEFIAKAYAQAKASNIIITARTQSDLERVKGELESISAGHQVQVSTCAGDAVDQKHYEQLADLINAKYGGRLDCLICNAGGGGDSNFKPEQRHHEMDMDDWTKFTTLNYLGPVYAAKYLLPIMLSPQSTGKTIINISSGASHIVELPPSWYSISKLALNRFTQGLAFQYAAEALIAIALHPGGVITPGAMAAAPHLKDVLTDDIHLCGAVCVWLSKVQPHWMSGRYMDVKWDVEELSKKKDEIVQGDKLKFRMAV